MSEAAELRVSLVTLDYYGHVYGCGWCGTVVEGEFPDCCEKMAEWKRRFAAAVEGPAPLPEPEPHEVARWRRVQQRWEGKHA